LKFGRILTNDTEKAAGKRKTSGKLRSAWKTP